MKATIVIDIQTLTPDERESVAKNLYAVASNIDDLIAAGGSSVAYGLLENINLPTLEILQKLSKYDEVPIREHIAMSKKTPVDILKVLADDPAGIVRYRVVVNPITPVDILTYMAKKDENDWRVLTYLCDREELPGEALKAIADKTNDDHIDRICKLINHRNTPYEVIEKFAFSTYPKVQVELAKNPRTPATALEALAASESVEIRSLVAANPSTPKEALLTLAGDPDVYVKMVLASNCQYSDVLEKMANDEDEDILHSLVLNSAITKFALETIIKRKTLNSASTIAKEKLDEILECMAE